MNDVVDELRALNQDRFASVELPDLDQLVEIEEQLYLSLPNEFKEFLMSVSDVVYGTIEPVTVSDPNLHTHLPDVTAQCWNDGVPRDVIPVCRFDDGYYVIDQEGIVSYWKDKKFKNITWDSIWDWAKDVWIQE